MACSDNLNFSKNKLLESKAVLSNNIFDTIPLNFLKIQIVECGNLLFKAKGLTLDHLGIFDMLFHFCHFKASLQYIFSEGTFGQVTPAAKDLLT